MFSKYLRQTINQLLVVGDGAADRPMLCDVNNGIVCQQPYEQYRAGINTKIARSELRPNTAMSTFTGTSVLRTSTCSTMTKFSTILLEAFYSCGAQQIFEALLRTTTRLEPPVEPLTAIWRG